jgi:hypothetical protein
MSESRSDLSSLGLGSVGAGRASSVGPLNILLDARLAKRYTVV